MEEFKQLIIRPITKVKFSGVSSYSKTQTVIEGAQIDINTGLYKNGLTTAEEAAYEEKLNLAKGTLNKKSEFWGDLQIRLNNDKLTILTIVSPLDELKLKVLQAHSLVANSEIEIANTPQAKFFIYDPEAAAKVEEVKVNFKLDAMEAFSKLSIDEKRNLLRVYGKAGTDSMSESMVKAELFKQLEANPEEFIKHANSKQSAVKGLLNALLEKKIIVKRGTYFYNGEDLLGSSTDEVLGYLEDIKNQAVRLALETKLKKSKK